MTRLISLLFFSAVVGTIAAGCKSSEASKETPQMETPAPYVQLAKERFGDDAEFIENSTGDFVLVVSKTEPSQMAPQPTASFFVFGKEKGEVTYESEIVGSVTWLDDYYLEVVVIPGIVKADSEPGGVTYRVDVRTGSRVEATTPARHR